MTEWEREKSCFAFYCGNFHSHDCQLTVLLSIEWNSIRLGGPAHGIVTKTVYKSLPGGGGGSEGGGCWVVCLI